MKKVNKEEFYQYIGKLDAHVNSVKNEFGFYTTEFKLKGINPIGLAVSVSYSDTKYYIN